MVMVRKTDKILVTTASHAFAQVLHLTDRSHQCELNRELKDIKTRSLQTVQYHLLHRD